MSIQIKKNPEYKLKLPRFLCDFVLKDGVPKPFDRLVAGYRFICICGNSGSGKTSMAVSMLTDKNILKKTFNNVICVIPESSRRSMKKDPFDDLDPSKLFESLQEIDRIYEMLCFYSSEDESSLLVIDDCQADLKDAYIANVLNKIIANRRHLKVSIIILLQTFNRLPLPSRKLLNLLITFKPSKREWESITELVELDQDTTSKIYKLCFPREDTDHHRWLMLDVPLQKFWSKYDEIIIKEDK